MSKKIAVARRGRPAVKLGPDFFVAVLSQLKDDPKVVSQIEGANNYFMNKVEDRGYVQPSFVKVTASRGRPSKMFTLTRKGREYLRKTNARKNADI